MAEYVGRAVAKRFPGYGRKVFRGRVTKRDPKDELEFHIKYEDGDEEDITRQELLKILTEEEAEPPVKRKRGRPPGSGKKGKQAVAAKARRSAAAEHPQPSAGGEEEEPGAATDEEEGEEGAVEGGAGPSMHDAEPATATAGRRGGGGRRGKAPLGLASPSSNLTEAAISGDEDLQALILDVSAKTKTRALNIVRYQDPEQDTAGNTKPLHATAVTCGSICFLSAIYADNTPSNADIDQMDDDDLLVQYTSQTQQVLAKLDQRLHDAKTSKKHLVHVEVLLREVDKGTPPFSTVWNQWLNKATLPAYVTKETFMDNGAVVAVAAQAAVAPQLF